MSRGKSVSSYFKGKTSTQTKQGIHGGVNYMSQLEVTIKQKLDEVVSYVKEIKGVDDSQIGYTYQLEGAVYKINVAYKNHKLKVTVDETGTVQGATVYILGLFPTKVTGLEGTSIQHLALSQWSDVLGK